MYKRQTIHALLHLCVACLILAIGLRTWLVMGLIEPVTVAGSSMEPTLQPGTRLWIDRTAWQWQEPRRWELVVARNPAQGDELCIKRIVALPEETLSLKSGTLWVDGKPLRRRVGKLRTGPKLTDAFPWKVPQWQLGPDEYFLLGDNHQVSIDSRVWGPVPRRLLLGRPIGVD